MSVTIMIAIAAACFIIGILCIAKGMSVEEQAAVPISNPSEIKELKKAFEPREAKPETAGEVKVALKVAAPSGPQPQAKNISDRGQSGQSEVDRLNQENKRLKEELRGQEEKFNQMEKNVEVLKTEYVQIKDRENQQVKTLEEKISAMQKNQEQAQDRSVIDELKAKISLLEKQCEESKAQELKLKETIAQLTNEKEEFGKAQKPTIDPGELDALSNRLSGSIATIETLKGENKKLQVSNEELKGNFNKTKEVNQRLMEKEKIMQFELVKNRAQTLGLEKICEDFRKQIESMSALTESK